MEYEAIAGAATIALLGSATFALAARSWIAFSRPHARRTLVQHGLLPESAQRYREAFELAGSKQSALLASAVVFVVLFGFAWISGAARLFAGTDPWLLALIATLLASAIAWASYRLLVAVRFRRRLARRCIVNIAVGQALHRVTGGLNRVFHDVACGSSVIDHVLIGQKGIYAINVIVGHSRKSSRVRARDGRLWFSPGRDSVALDVYATKSEQLARKCRKAIGGRVHVRTVLVVSGSKIEEQPAGDFLVVNERNLVMLRGWRDRSEYLMNEDVETLHDCIAGLAAGSGASASALAV